MSECTITPRGYGFIFNELKALVPAAFDTDSVGVMMTRINEAAGIVIPNQKPSVWAAKALNAIQQR